MSSTIYSYSLLLLFVIGALSQAQTQDSVIRIPATQNVNSVEFAQDGGYFLALDRDTLRVWDVSSGKQIGTSIPLSSIRGYATFLPGDSTVLTVAYASDSTFNIWNWRTGSLVRSVKLFRTIDEAVASKDGRYIAIRVHFPKNQYELWDIATSTYQYVFLDEGYKNLLLNPTGEYGTIQAGWWVYRINIKTHGLDLLHMDQSDLFQSYLSRDGRLIGYSRENNPPLVLSNETLDSLFALDIDMSEYTRVTMGFSHDNDWISTITTRRFGVPTLDVWNASTGSHVITVAADSSIRYGTLRMSPDNKYVAIYNIPDGIILWPVNLPITSAPAVTGSRQQAILIYPNPSSTDVTVEWQQVKGGSARLKVLTAQGKPVYISGWSYYEPGIGFGHVPVESLASGLYFCEVESAGQRHTTPLIIEH